MTAENLFLTAGTSWYCLSVPEWYSMTVDGWSTLPVSGWPDETLFK
jgi:hypothetical protein